MQQTKKLLTIISKEMKSAIQVLLWAILNLNKDKNKKKQMIKKNKNNKKKINNKFLIKKNWICKIKKLNKIKKGKNQKGFF